MELLNPYISFGVRASGFFVSPSGNNSAAGTEAAPWATFAFAVDQLAPGDTLVAKGGTYYEQNVTITTDGTTLQPITIVAADGETPIIDGSLSAYRTAGNSAWEVYDAGRHIYRTVATLPSPGDFNYTGSIDVSGTLYALTAYAGTIAGTGLAYLSADADLFDPDNPYYMGPGVSYETDGHVYIRLDPNTSAAHWDAITPFVIADLDPRNHATYLTPNGSGFIVNADHITIDGIDLRHHWAVVTGNGTNLTFKNSTLFPSRFGIRTEGSNWTIDNVTIDHHRPSWMARSDVKSGGEAAKDSRTGGISWEDTFGHTLTNSTITGAFDGMLLLGSSNRDITITNCVIAGSMDDGCQTGSAAYNIEFGHNLWTGAGPSHDGSGADAADTPASIYVHHNVFDNSGTVFWARKPIEGVEPSELGEGGYLHPPIHSTHGVPDFDDPWKIYNNTYQGYNTPGLQGFNHFMYHGASPGEGVHEAYNNIFNYNTPDDYVYRYANAFSGLEIFDYNIYARATTLAPWAIESVDTTNTPVVSIDSFASWRTTMGGTTGYYPAGWDSHSVSQTTMVPLDGSYQPAIGGPADGNGLDLSATGWPGTTPGTDHIGAKAPV